MNIIDIARECGAVVAPASGTTMHPRRSVTFFVSEHDDQLAALESRIRADERERCAKLCNDYSAYLIKLADGAGGECEDEAHGAEGCSHLIAGRNEYGDPPNSPHFGDSFAASRNVPSLTDRQVAFHNGIHGNPQFSLENVEKSVNEAFRNRKEKSPGAEAPGE